MFLHYCMVILLCSSYVYASSSTYTIRPNSAVEDKHYVGEEMTDSTISCARMCSMQNCNAANFNERSKRCAIYSSNIVRVDHKGDGVTFVKDIEDCNDAGTSEVIHISTIGPVYCENVKDGGGWMVFQRRFNGSVDFYRGWEDYKNGFGDMEGEFWLGLEKLHQLTSSGQYMLTIDMEDFENNTRYAVYSRFRIGNEGMGYQLDIGGYYGDAGDCLARHNGMKFSTKDIDHDNKATSCAEEYKGAWWYNCCHCSNLNGLYLGGHHVSYADGMEWLTWKGDHYSLKTSKMMIRKL